MELQARFLKMLSCRVIGAAFLVLLLVDFAFAARSFKAVGEGGSGGGG